MKIQQQLKDFLQTLQEPMGTLSEQAKYEEAQRQCRAAAINLSQRTRRVQATQEKLQRCRNIAQRLGTIQQELADKAVVPKESSITKGLQDSVTACAMQSMAGGNKVKLTKSLLQAAEEQRKIIEETCQGIRNHGFSGYLQRAPQAERKVILQLTQEAQQEGAKGRGRKAADYRDPRKKKKEKYAAKARERRAAQKIQPPTEETKAQDDLRRKKRRDARRQQRQHERQEQNQQDQITRSDIAPLERRHDQRMVKMSPEQQAIYQARLEKSREKGRQALVKDLTAHRALGVQKFYQPLHGSVSHSQGSRLIAVRGDNWQGALAGLTKNTLVLEDWLADPARQRNADQGGRARLNFAAGHLLVALPAHLHGALKTGKKDASLAYIIDRLIARMGLEGHRVSAYLHLDSKSGHPHLHITFARVRMQDLSLWSLEGRMRTPAMWVHGRTETALGFGEDVIPDDLDALGGSGEAALAGEALMASGKLFATRKDLGGKVTKIPLQGHEAAIRLHAVGQSPSPLPGGMGKFGCGKDPKEEKAWAEALKKAKKEGNHELIKQLMARKPENRGWWLPLNGKGEEGKFGKYLKGESTYSDLSYLGRKSTKRR